MQVLTIIRGKEQNPIGLLLIQHLLGFRHIRTNTHYFHIWRGVNPSGKLTTQIGITLIYHHHLRLVYYLVIIYK